MPGGPVLHCASVKMRVVGQGIMKCKLLGFDDIETDDLYPQTLSPKNRQEHVMLANMQGERMKLRITTESLDDFVRVNNITFFIKPLWNSNPVVGGGESGR